MQFDHVAMSVPESKFEELIAFLVAALAPFGFREIRRPFPGLVALGTETSFLWFAVDKSGSSDEVLLAAVKKTHMAFTATTSEEVRQFYDAAIKAGGIDNGKPGLREHFGPGYYAAFVRDPGCGINFEVVSRNGEA